MTRLLAVGLLLIVTSPVRRVAAQSEQARLIRDDTLRAGFSLDVEEQPQGISQKPVN